VSLLPALIVAASALVPSSPSSAGGPAATSHPSGPSPERIDRAIHEGTEYLLRSINPKFHAVPRLYDVETDDAGKLLHTTYTASVAYTLLKVNDLFPDPRIPPRVKDCVRFLLSMQVRDGSRRHGAFRYSFNTATGQAEDRLVSGSAAKCIFTLLEAHGHDRDPACLAAARAAADWLVTMIRPDGSVVPYVRLGTNGWVRARRHSLLYDGQTLSALSRTYAATGEARYLAAALEIAHRLAAETAAQGWYLGDDYRPKNPVSTSWVALSLLDFWRVSRDAESARILAGCNR
jgi:uncharacterized protein YyaL (SSP411 family)